MHLHSGQSLLCGEIVGLLPLYKELEECMELLDG